MQTYGRQSGFTLIEVAITLVILAIGLLGLAGLQSKMLNSEMEVYQRSHALVLAQDMANRLNTNRVAARAGQYSGATVYGTGNTTWGEDCGLAGSVAFDLCSWSNALRGRAADGADGGDLAAMIGARGCIETVSGTATSQIVLRVTVAWQGLEPTVAPSATCGVGQYGADDRLRRAVSMLVTLAYLGET